MARLSEEQNLITFLFADLSEMKPYPMSMQFERFVLFRTQDLPMRRALALQKLWEERKQEVMELPFITDLPLSEEEKKEIAAFMLCTEAKEFEPGWWHLFQDRLAVLH